MPDERAEKQGGFESDPLKFAALMAHQMQSPLSAVGSLLQALMGEYAGPLLPQQREALEKADARCRQASDAVRRMLAITRAQFEAERPPPPAPLLAVVRQAHSRFVSEAAARGIELLLLAGDAPACVRPGEAALDEILGALLGNALKYTPDHGRVELAVSFGATDAWARLTVSDSGTGVPEPERERIFQPFYRASAARDSARPGIGLGLAFVKSVVTAAGGTVRVDKSSLGGAVFTLELPAAEPPAAGGAGDDGAPAPRIVIVGGVTAGTKAAAKIIRLVPGADVTVVERGTILSYAGCGLPYYVSGQVRDQKRLISSPAGTVRDPVFFRSVKSVHVLNGAEALAVDRAGRRVHVRDGATRRESWLPYDKLVLATGASPNLPAELNHDLENVFTLHGVRDAEGIRTALAGRRARDAVIVGGGLLGIEITQAFVSQGARVTILERRPHILPILDDDMAALVERHLEANGVRIVTGAGATALRGSGRVSHVVTEHGEYAADVVVLALGVHPNVQLARDAGLRIGVTGAIAVDARMRTSDPDIFAAGDCAETTHLVTGRPYYFPLGSTATKQGRTAAVSLCGGEDAFPGVLGSCICRVFDYSVARVGLGEREAAECGYQTVCVYAPGPDREHFMPEAKLLLLKLIVDRATRRLLGAQATGRGVADKRIDVAAMAILNRMTVDQLAAADLCYSAPFAPVMDNLITAANVARNKLDGRLRGVTPADVWRLLGGREEFVLLDVRTPEEFERGHLPRAVSMPLGSLRGRMAAELPARLPIVTVCDLGLRAYEAALILGAAGFEDVRVLDGGMAMWPYEGPA